MILDLKQQQKNEEIDAMLRIRPLTDADKHRIFKTIRFSFMTHDELLRLSGSPEFALGKELILQGLSCKLNNYEHGAGELLINTKPRDCTLPPMGDDPSQVPLQRIPHDEGAKNPPIPQSRKTPSGLEADKKHQEMMQQPPYRNYSHAGGNAQATMMNPYVKNDAMKNAASTFSGQYKNMLNDERNRLSAFPN